MAAPGNGGGVGGQARPPRGGMRFELFSGADQAGIRG